jgi:hypothetical protein
MDMHHILYNFLELNQQKNLTSLPNPLLVPTVLAGRPNIPRATAYVISEIFRRPAFGAARLDPAILVDELDAPASSEGRIYERSD